MCQWQAVLMKIRYTHTPSEEIRSSIVGLVAHFHESSPPTHPPRLALETVHPWLLASLSLLFYKWLPNVDVMSQIPNKRIEVDLQLHISSKKMWYNVNYCKITVLQYGTLYT